LDAYAEYRRRVADPWPLVCCGQGPLADALAKAPGVEDLGFVQPQQQPDLMARAGVFVLPSRDDPWPLAVGEHAASGLPLICSEAVGSAAEVLRTYYNGLAVSSGDTAALSAALLWMHEHHGELPEMGRCSQELARPYSAAAWARRWLEVCRELIGGRQ
jgi:glycosyltransferase involved in cell wall biosynthesis